MLSIENTITNAAAQHMKSSEKKLNQLNKNFSDELKNAKIVAKHNADKPVDKKLLSTCQEMESLFVAKMFKEMRKTVNKHDLLHGGFAQDIFEDMLYDKYAMKVSENSNLGMAKLLYDEMSRFSGYNPSQKNLKA